MIDSPATVSPSLDRADSSVRLPVPAGLGRLLVLSAVFVCAACGLVYELELVALASYLVGDTVTQTSVVLSLMVFAMGVGSLAAKRLRPHAAVAFGLLEALLALVGGVSAMVLYACFAWFGQAGPALVAFSLLLGALIGVEMPLLMTLIQRVRRQDAGGAVADLFAADYVGALAGGLAFPFILLPMLGQLTGALVTGVVNALVGGGLVLWLFRQDLSRRGRRLLMVANAAVIVLLLAAISLAGPFERAAQRAIYGAEVRVATVGEQEIVLTGSVRDGDVRLFVDGRLQVSGAERGGYHEALVHPAMTAGPRQRVLVLGSGDGAAVREVLRYPDVEAVTMLGVDPGLVELARTDPGLRELSGAAHDDPRVSVIGDDPFDWLRSFPGPADVLPSLPYDVIIADLPDPGITQVGKLYSQEFYGLTARALAPHGRLAVHAGDANERAEPYWTADATLRAAGFATTPYVVHGGQNAFSSGPDRSQREQGTRHWGFLLAAPGMAPALSLADAAPGLRSLTPETLVMAEREARRERVTGLPASTLAHPRYSAMSTIG